MSEILNVNKAEKIKVSGNIDSIIIITLQEICSKTFLSIGMTKVRTYLWRLVILYSGYTFITLAISFTFRCLYCLKFYFSCQSKCSVTDLALILKWIFTSFHSHSHKKKSVQKNGRRNFAINFWRMYVLTKNLNGGGYVRTVDLHQSFQLNSLTINTFFPVNEWDGKKSAGWWRGKKRRKYDRCLLHVTMKYQLFMMNGCSSFYLWNQIVKWISFRFKCSTKMCDLT